MNPVPPGWTSSTVAEIGTISGGLTRHAGKRAASADIVPLVSVAAVQFRQIDKGAIGTISILPEDRDRGVLRKGDVLVVEGNGSLSHIGRVALWDGSVEGARHQNHIICIRPHAVSPEFLLNWLASPDGRARIVEAATSAAGLYTLSLSKVGALEVLVPPMNEQRRIVAKLEDLLARSRRAKDALDAVPPLLEKLRQSILAAAFRGDLTAEWRKKNPDVEPADKLLARIRIERRKKWEEAELAKMKAKGKPPTDDRWKAKYQEPEPVDASELPELPDGWCWAAWREIGFSQNGRPFPSSVYQDSGVRLLRPGNLHVSGQLVWTPENTRYLDDQFARDNPDLLIGADQILMNLTAQSLKDEFLGRVCLSSHGERSLLNQRLARLTPTTISPRLIFWLFKSPLVRAYIDELNSGSLIQHMFTSQVDDFALPLPPAEEHAPLVRSIDTAMARLASLRDAHDGAGNVFAGMEAAILAKAFRGQLVPQDPNDEPASATLERLNAKPPSTDGTDTPRTTRKSRGQRSSEPA